MAGLHLVVGAEVRAGNEHTASHGLPVLRKLLEELRVQRRQMVRRDNGYGSGSLMRALKSWGQRYLFKSHLSKNVSTPIATTRRTSAKGAIKRGSRRAGIGRQPRYPMCAASGFWKNHALPRTTAYGLGCEFTFSAKTGRW